MYIDKSCFRSKAKSYRFTINNIEINSTRALLEDTVVISLVTMINGIEAGRISKALGAVSEGVHDVDLSLEIKIEKKDIVSFGYVVMNSDNGESMLDKIEDCLIEIVSNKTTTIVAEILGDTIAGPIGGIISMAATYFIGELSEIFNPENCNGIVAADTIIYKGSQLKSIPVSYTRRSQYKNESTVLGCKDSEYCVQWSINAY